MPGAVARAAATAADMFGHRSSGRLSSIRSTAAASSSGQSGRSSRIGVGGAVTCACRTASVAPSKGGRPVSIW